MKTTFKKDKIIQNIALSAMLVVLYVIINRFIAINIATLTTIEITVVLLI